jgi:hypothetical protein
MRKTMTHLRKEPTRPLLDGSVQLRDLAVPELEAGEHLLVEHAKAARLFDSSPLERVEDGLGDVIALAEAGNGHIRSRSLEMVVVNVDQRL